MPLPLAGALWAVFAANMIPLAIRLLVGLGIGAASYVGAKAMIDAAKAQIIALISGAGTVAVQWAAFFHVDKVITLILSALVVRLVLKGLDKVTDTMRTTTFTPPTAP
jgi:hypothetical protein